MTTNFAIGDYVKVTNRGKLFREFGTMAEKMGLKNWVRGKALPDGDVHGEVVGVRIYGCDTILGIRVEDTDYLIRSSGVELADPGFVDLVKEEPTKREYVRFQQVHDKKNRPIGMVCLLHDKDGLFHVGTSWCNITSGDTYLKKEAKRLSRQRAEIARDFQMTAYYKDGRGVMMMHNFKLDQEQQGSNLC